MRTTGAKQQAGFTLVELLIVAAILGIVMAAVYSLYVTNMRSAYVGEEVVDVQQNLRIANDVISRDIRMSGFMIPSDEDAMPNPPGAANTTVPIRTYQNNASPAPDSITLNEASNTGTYAVIDLERTGIGAFTVESSDTVDLFSVNNTVRIIDVRLRQPVKHPLETFGSDRTYRVDAISPATRTLTLSILSRTGGSSSLNEASLVFRRGDIIARVSDGIPNPNTVTYRLIDSATSTACPAGMLCLARISNEGTGAAVTQVIANNLRDMQIRYILDTTPVQEVDAPTDLQIVRAVRFTLVGQTELTTRLVQTMDGDERRRQLDFVVESRNR